MEEADQTLNWKDRGDGVSGRPIYLLTLQVEHEEVHGLRAVLKRLIRDHGLKCIDIRKLEETNMSDDLFDLNDAEVPGDPELASPGLYWLRVEVQPGAVTDDHLLLAKNGYTWHLKLKCTVQGEKYAGAVVFDYITLKYDTVSSDGLSVPLPAQQTENYKTAVRMGRSKLRALLESAFRIAPDDYSEEANAKRRVKDNDFLNLNGLVFYARVDVRKGTNGYKDSNSVDYIVTPGMPEWPIKPAQGKQVVSRAEDLDDEIAF
jgi:hypothetical protein